MSRLLARLLAVLFAGVTSWSTLAVAQALPPAVNALPSGGQVVVGQAQITQSANATGAQMVVQQNTPRLGIDWHSFHIGSGAAVEFRQPDASSIALNRIIGNDASLIYGRLSANGQVFLVNPNGVLFAPGAKVDVGGLVASTLDLSQQDFAEGRFRFAGDSAAGVSNAGQMGASAGGYLVLLGRQVDNSGTLNVPAGQVMLASGRAATVSIAGGGLISAVVDPTGAAGSVLNSGHISADGGTVRLSAHSAEALAGSLVNNTGIVRANSIEQRNGEIWITGDTVRTSGRVQADGAGSLDGGRIVAVGDMQRGRIEVAGELSARAEGGRGGSVETSAARVAIDVGTQVVTLAGSGQHGSWTIDPLDFTVSPGNAAQNASGIGATTLSNNLNNGGVRLVAARGSGTEAGDVTVAAGANISWSANTSLTIDAVRDVNVNADISASGSSAGLVILPGSTGSFNLATGSKVTLAGSQATLQIAGVSYTLIRDLAALQAIDADNAARSGNYALPGDLNIAASATLNNNAGFAPIGGTASFGSNDSFRGRFEGLGNTLSGLTINRPTSNNVGLFGATHDATISNLTLADVSIVGNSMVGALAGSMDAQSPSTAPTRVTNVHASGSITASNRNQTALVGGLIGQFNAGTTGTVTRSTTSGSILIQSPGANAGGLIGQQHAGLVSASSSSVNLSTDNSTNSRTFGGLVGYLLGTGSIANSSASGSIAGAYNAGGLVAYSESTGTLSSVSASGSVSGWQNVGGLVGYFINSGGMNTVSASGSVEGQVYAGGLFGYGANSAAITAASRTGSATVSGPSDVGGIAGRLQNVRLVNATVTSPVQAVANASNSNTVYAGGLVGRYDNAGNTSTQITGSSVSAAGSVTSAAPFGYVGGLVGYGSNLSVSNSTAGGPVQITTPSTSSTRSVGGLIGYFDGNGTLASVGATGAVSAGYYAGGLIGFHGSTGTINLATASGNVSGSQYVGGLIGFASGFGAITNSQAIGNVTTNWDGGGLIGYAQSGGGITDSRATGNVASTSNRASVGGLVGYTFSAGPITNSSAAGTVRGGQSAGGLVGQLNYTSVTQGTATGSVSVTNDSTVYAGGLVGYLTNNNDATVQVSSSSATGSVFVDATNGYLGGLVGYSSGGGIATSSASGAVTGVDSTNPNNTSIYAGGLVGYIASNLGTIADSSASGRVQTAGRAGGLVGQFSSQGGLSNVSASGAVSGNGYVGGLVGYYQGGSVVNGSASGDVTSTRSSDYTGGLLGYAYVYADNAGINDSRASGNVSGGSATGGLVGQYDDYSRVGSIGITNSSATGNVSGTGTSSSYTGGLVGYYRGVYDVTGGPNGISASLARGNVSGNSYVGGLVGYFDGYAGIRDSFATGNVLGTATTTDKRIGGLAGYFFNRNNAAGMGVIARAYASGSVALDSSTTLSSGSDVFTGGLVGVTAASSATQLVVVDSYSTGAVASITSGSLGRLRAGGLVGQTQSGSLSRTYATGAVTIGGGGTRAAGGLVGEQGSGTTATNSFWATDATGQATSPLGTGVTLAALHSAATFSGWSVATAGGSNNTWRIYEGFTTPLVRSLLTPLTVTIGDVTKVYDGTSGLGSAPISFNGVAVSNPERVLLGGSAVNAGTYALTAANLYSTQNGYDLSATGSGTLTINRRPLTLTGLVNDKVYDGSRSATISGTPLFGGLVAGEDLVFSQGSGFGALFDTKNVGNDKTVTLSGSFGIADGTRGRAANYQLPSGNTTTADITPASITAGSFVATNRAYDGTTIVAVTPTAASPTGVIAGDRVTVDVSNATTGTMADKNAGIGKAVTVNGIVLGDVDAGNYVVAGANAVTVNITPRALTLNGMTAADRQYNRGTNASLSSTGAALSGVVSGDTVAAAFDNVSGSVADKNVGNAKPVTVTGLALRGPDAGNYSVLSGPVSMNITPYPLTLYLERVTGSDKVYDGNNVAQARFPVYWYFGDDITVNTTGITFADKSVAYNNSGTVIAKTITAAGLSISGADAGNYTLQNSSATSSGTITPRPLTVSGVSAVNRVYDGTRNVTINISGATVDTSAVVAGDVVSVTTPGTGNVTGQMANKNAGNNKPVTVPGLALTGADAGNYSITAGGSGVTVNIARKDLTAIYTGVNKVYDGNAYAGLNVTSDDVVAGDAVGFFADQSYCTFCGYAYFTESGRLPNGGYVESRHVGDAKPIVVTSNGLRGADAGNYTLLNPTGLTAANITPKPINLAFSGVTKVYDGTVDAAVQINLGGSGIASGDTVSATQTAIYTGSGAKNVGNGKPIAVSNIVFGGTHAGNYTVGNTTATTSGNVTPKPVTVSGITATDRAYDGTTTVAVSAGTLGSSGFVAGDTVTVTPPVGGISTGTMANKNVGTNKPVTVTGLTLTGTDAGNYLIDAASSGITVNITPFALTPTFTGVDRVYNGGITASVTSTTSGIVSGDTVTFTQQAIFTGADARNVGTAKPIAVSNITLGGAGAANYSLASTSASATASITPKPVNVTYVGASRVYNGLADVSASVVGSSLQFVAGDSVGVSETARFTGDGSAGTNKPVSVTNIGLTGIHAANYSLGNTTASTTATITPRPLGVTGITATHRVYDGTTTVAVNVSGATVDTSNVIAGDQVNVTLPPSGISTGDMDDRFAGSGKRVNITGLAIGGSSASNYSLIGAAGLTVNISPLAISASYVGANKVYNGSADAAVSASSGSFLSVDSGLVGISASGVFTDGKNVGTGKAIAVSGAFLTGAARDSYTLANPSGVTLADITPRTLTASFSGTSREYDGSVNAVVNGSLSNRVSGDQVDTTQSAVFTGVNAKNVGNGKPIAVSNIALTGADAGNYTLATTSSSATGAITPKPITVSGLNNVVAVDRTYDGTRNVAVNVPSGVTLAPVSSDIVAGDVVTIAVPPSGATTGTMADKNAGNAKPVTVDGLSLSGADSANYRIAGTAGITVNISPKTLTATWAGVNRVYDGTVNATASGSSAGIVAGDSLTIRGSGSFTGNGAKNVGTAKPVSITSASLGGEDRNNYQLLNSTGDTTADITPRAITPTYTGGTRVYDGTAAAPVTAQSSGLIAGDDVALTQTAVFTGAGAKNVGNNKAVAVSGIALTGTDQGNYALTTSSAGTTASVTPRPVTLTGLTGVTATDRVYDGTTTVAVNVNAIGPIGINPGDVIAGDDVSAIAPSSGATTGTMLDKRVGNNKPLTVNGLGLAGTDASNYTVAAVSGLTVNIARREITASYVGQNKVYDGTDAATLLGTSSGLISGDSIAIAGNGVFAGGKNVGSGKLINVTGGTLSGTDAGNYALLNSAGTATADITPKTVTASYVGGTRIYDGTTDAPVSGSLSGLISGDSASVTQSAGFTGAGAKNVGNNKPVAVSGIALAGSDAGNYVLGSTSASTTASITPRPINIAGLSGITATSREYDGTNVVAVSVGGGGGAGSGQPSPGDIIAGDNVIVGTPGAGLTTGTMLDKHVGTGKAVVVSGLTLSGTDAPNYFVAGTNGVTVNITPRTLTASYAGASKVYDGTATIDLTGQASGVVLGDALTIGGVGTFTGAGARNVGTAKPISLVGATLAGADARNYLLANPDASLTGDITPRPVTASYTGGTREYDGTTAAPVTGSLSGLVSGDSLALTQTAQFIGGGAKNVGSNKAVSITGIALAGADAGNYSLGTTSGGTTASITPRLLTINGLTGITATDRAYDGTANVAITIGAVGTLTADVIAGDQVTISAPTGGPGVGTMADKHVGTNKPVAVASLLLSGADAGNYLVGPAQGVTVNITPLQLQVSGVSAQSRVYDGTRTVALDTAGGSLAGALSGDDVRLLISGAAGEVADKNVGSNKAVTLGGLALGGSDARNYTVVTPGLTASITPRALSITASVADRLYDGTTAAAVTYGDNRVSGDVVTLTAASAAFADKNAGSNKTIDVSGLILGGADAGNYTLANSSLALNASILRAPLTVSASNQSKLYGDTFVFTGREFIGSGLVAGETIGDVTLTSPGAAASAGVSGGPYAITASNARGGTFDAGNYLLSYQGGALNVAPRPLSVVTNSVVRYVDEPNPTSFGFSTSVGGLANGDTVASVVQAVPPGSANAPGGSVFELTPSGAVFAPGEAGNYAISYAGGLLVVLPRPPRIGENEGSSGDNGGNQGFAVAVSEADLQRALRELERAAGRSGGGTERAAGDAGSNGLPQARRTAAGSLPAAELEALASQIAVEVAGGGGIRVNLPTLLRMPLITFDPQLRRLVFGNEGASTTR